MPLALIIGAMPASTQALGPLAVPPLGFSGLGDPDADVSINRLVFHGLGENDRFDVGALVFSGLGDRTPPDLGALIFVGLGGEETAVTSTSLRFEGMEMQTRRVRAAEVMRFEGWGSPVQHAEAQRLTFRGLGPEEVRIDRFDKPSHGWTSNDGPGSLSLDRTQALCVWDNFLGTLTVQPPARFLGDWGGPDGELSFRVYYTGATQWPVVITLYGRSGSAFVRRPLTSRGAQGFELVRVYLDAIWWTYSGVWEEIIHDVIRVEIELDIKDGFDNANEACIDDFTLRIGHRS